MALPKNPIRTLGVEWTSPRDEGAGKAGGPRKARGAGCRGSRRSRGVPGPGRAGPSSRLKPHAGSADRSPMMVRAAETITTGSESALILPHYCLSSYGWPSAAG